MEGDNDWGFGALKRDQEALGAEKEREEEKGRARGG